MLINEERLDKFMGVYADALRKALAEHPGDYAYGPDKIPDVLARMREIRAQQEEASATAGPVRITGIDVSIADVDPFPFVPATRIDGNARCGFPRARSSARMRPRPGRMPLPWSRSSQSRGFTSR